MKKLGLVVFIVMVLFSFGCAEKNEAPIEGKISPIIITAEEAKKMMDESQVMVIDVRTPEEYKEGHVDKAINLPLDQIANEIMKVLPDKEATVLLYCRSGNRSAQAAKILSDLDYTKVYDFGGINDWPYDVVVP